jgi:hypothetical protein
MLFVERHEKAESSTESSDVQDKEIRAPREAGARAPIRIRGPAPCID